MCSVLSDFLRPHELYPARLLCPWNFPDKNTGVGWHFLLQGIFPSQGSNPCLLHWQADSLPLHHLESPSTVSHDWNSMVSWLILPYSVKITYQVKWADVLIEVLKAKSTSGLRSHMIILLDDDITLSRVHTAFLSTSLDNLNFNRRLLVMMLFTIFLGQKAIIILEGLWWYIKEATGDHRGKRLMFSWAFQNLQVPISFI